MEKFDLITDMDLMIKTLAKDAAANSVEDDELGVGD